MQPKNEAIKLVFMSLAGMVSNKPGDGVKHGLSRHTKSGTTSALGFLY